MISSRQIQWTQGRVYVLLAASLLCAWALRVIHTSQVYLPDREFKADESDLRMRARDLLAVPERSVLVQFYRMIGVPIQMMDPRGEVRPDPREVVLVLQPQAEAPVRLAEQLEAYVSTGGRLVVITSTPFELLKRFGLELVRNENRGRHAVLTAGATVEGDAATRLAFDADLELRSKGPSMLPLLLREDGVCVGGMIQHGRGTVIAVGGDPDRYQQIAHEDNIVFLANLILGPTPAGRPNVGWSIRDRMSTATVPALKVLDLDPEILRQLYDLVKIRISREREARANWNYDDLWSLIRANPVCAALIQLLIGLLVFLGARARRLGDPLPESATLLAPLPALAPGWGACLERSHGLALAADSAFEWHRRRLIKRLGLPADADSRQIMKALSEISPTHDETFKRFAGLVTQIRRIPRSGSAQAREEQGAALLTEIWHTIDSLEQELGIRD